MKFPRMPIRCGTFDILLIFILYNIFESMNENLLKELSNAIIEVFDKNGNKIEFSNVEIKLLECNRSHDKYIKAVYLDSERIPINGTKITYKCSCGNIRKILLKKFISKPRLRCSKCSEDEEKRKNHSLFFKNGFQIRTTEKKHIDYNFDDESNEFKKMYYEKHLTDEEFLIFIKHVTSINGINISNKDVKYLSHYKCNNQYKYNPCVNIDNSIIPFKNIIVKCPICGSEYKISQYRCKKDKFKTNFSCRKCKFFNLKFPILKYKTVFGDIINYQSKLEMNFINLCEKKGIRVLDGFQVEYLYNNRNHVYISDFYLPAYKMVVELKDNHIWHLKQVENGKWGAKEKAICNFCKENDYTFKLLFRKDFDKFFNTLNEIV